MRRQLVLCIALSILAVAMVSCNGGGGGGEDDGNGDEDMQPTIGNVTADATGGVAPLLEVSFGCEATGGNEPLSYSWDFGDGRTGTGADISHTYYIAGEFTATCTVTDDDGDSDSGSAPSVTVDEPAQKSWTIMVYLDGDNNLEGEAIDDFNEMETVGSDANINVVVLIDRINGYDASNGNWTGARYYFAEYDSNVNIINSTLLKSPGELNMGDPQTLEDFIIWSVTNFPALHYAVILWNHGSGWKYPEYRSLKAVAFDDTDGGDELTNTDLKEALEAALTFTGLTSIDVIGFDACLMQMAEIAYYLQDHADYVVASEETEPGWGWPYDMWLGDLAATPGMSPAELGRAMVQAYYDHDTWNDTLSSVDLSMMDNLASSVDIFASELITQETSYLAEICGAWANSKEFWDEDYVDLYDFASLVATSEVPVPLADAANDVTAAVDDAVDFNMAHVSDSNGLSIYFPDSSYYSNSYDVLDFAIDTQWDEFISGLSCY